MRSFIAAVFLILGWAGPQNPAAPSAKFAWPSGPMEVRVAFDQAVSEANAKTAVGTEIAIEAEPGKPAVGSLRIAAAHLEDGGHTLVLATDPHPFAAIYRPASKLLPAYTLGGVAVEFEVDGKPALTSWWPSLDAKNTLAATASSASHATFLAATQKPGLLKVRTMVQLPKGKGKLSLTASHAIIDPVLGLDEIKVDGLSGAIDFESSGEPKELAFDVKKTEASAAAIFVDATIAVAGQTPRPLLPAEFALPWSTPAPALSADVKPLPDAMLGGDIAKGKAVFFSETAKCSVCHATKDGGGKVGPDLTGQREKDLAMIYRDVLEPSAVVRADFVAFTVTTKDGQVLAGVARADGADGLLITDTAAKTTRILKADIDELRPSATSAMPVGLPGAIGDAGMRDLLAYLKSL